MRDITFIKRLDVESDLKPSCHRCGYSTDGVFILNNEWICMECLTKEEWGVIRGVIGEIFNG